MLMSKTHQTARQIKREKETEIRGQISPAIIIRALTTRNHPSKQRNGAYSYAKKRRILKVKTMRIDSSLQIYNGARPTKKGVVEKRVGLSTACYRRRCKKMDETIATGDNSKPFTVAFQT
jgi:hypothetical protein